MMRLISSGFSGFFSVYTPSSSSPTVSTRRWLSWRLSLVRLLTTAPSRIRTTSGDRGADLFRNVTSSPREVSVMWKSSPWNKVLDSSSTGLQSDHREEGALTNTLWKRAAHNSSLTSDRLNIISLTFHRSRQNCEEGENTNER